MASGQSYTLLIDDLLAPSNTGLFDELGHPILEQDELEIIDHENWEHEEHAQEVAETSVTPTDLAFSFAAAETVNQNYSFVEPHKNNHQEEGHHKKGHHKKGHHNDVHLDDVLPVFDINFAKSKKSNSIVNLGDEATLDLSLTFALHSNVNAAHTIYLDFDGHITTHSDWTGFNHDQTIVTNAFDLDGDHTTFSTTELERIQFIWQRVAEDFIPFDVNVTTADPGLEALRRTGSNDQNWGTRVVIGAGEWLGVAAGGVAYLSSFTSSEDLPAFVFTNHLGGGLEKATAEAISHEVGHTLGLYHDGQADNDYYTGHGTESTGWAPIMGASYFQEVTQWSQGEYSGATSRQDDLAVITGQNGFSYRPDDHGNHFQTATSLAQITKVKKKDSPSASLYGQGIIEQNTDSDFFRFDKLKGKVVFNINPAERGANLDILANLYDRNYNLIATSNPVDSLSASFDLKLKAGTYYLEIDGVGKGNPLDEGYSDYGSLGQYTIEADIYEPEESAPIDLVGMSANLDGYALAGMALMAEAEYDYVAVQDGSWFAPTTWAGGVIPLFNGASVHIPEGVSVSYDAESDIRLDTVTLDGSLIFAHDQNTKMIVDTIMASATSSLSIGTEDNPVQADVQTQIIIDSEFAVSDAAKIEKGIISMGAVSIYGADKLDFVALQDASAGDNKLILDLPDGSTAPLGWKVGDRLVLGGTQYNQNGSNADNSKFQDEILTITAITGNEISFINENITSGDNTVLRFDHHRPDGFEDQTDIYVANTTRNISISTENGGSVPIENRGHVMFMHSDDVKVFNAGFYDLGRTDKSRLIDEIGVNPDGSQGYGTNVRGRYAVHFHHVGMHDSSEMMHSSSMMTMPMTTPGIASGNAIVGSPGWGLVHHNSNATFEDNVVFDVVGSGIVSEGGAETGNWNNNITIKTTGDDNPALSFGHSDPRVRNFDLGFNGEGYWVQGAGQIAMTNNIAVSAAGSGITVFGGGDGGASARNQHTISVSNLPIEWQDMAQGYGDGSVVDVAAVPLKLLSGFEAYNVDEGIITWGSMLNSDGQHQLNVPGSDKIDTVVPAHDYRGTIDEFKLWGIRNDGVQLWYSSQYDVSNGLILSDTTKHANGRGSGVNNNGKNHRFRNLHVEDFKIGITLPNDSDGEGQVHRHRDLIASVIEDSYISGEISNFDYFNNDSHYLELKGQNEFGNPIGDNVTPVADFEAVSIGDTAYSFNGAASFDADPWRTGSKFETQGIVAYAWDFDSDGVIDSFGRDTSHYFNETGEHSVSLTVWDQDGATATLTQTLDVQSLANENAFLNGEFTENPTLNYSKGSSIDANLGWAKSYGVIDPLLGNDGAIVLTTGNKNSVGLTQVIEDDTMRRGIHQFSVTLKNTEGSLARDFHVNTIAVSLYGVNGQFMNKAQDQGRAPKQVGALAFEMEELSRVDVGGESYDWQKFEWDVNLGSGYEYLVAEIYTLGGNQAGDYIAVDQVSLTKDASVF